MSRFEDITGYQSVCDAIEKANILLNPYSDMMSEIRLKNDFKYDSGLGEQVWLTLSVHVKVVPIKLYTPFNPFTRAIAMTNGDGCIYFNSRKIGKRSLNEIVGTLLHEYAHIRGFNHGNNFPSKEKNLYSVPYWLSSNVERWRI